MKNSIILLLLILTIVAIKFILLKEEEIQLITEQNDVLKSFLPNTIYDFNVLDIESNSEAKPPMGYKNYNS